MCPRYHQYRYIERKHAITTSSAARFGTLFHAGLEAWWLGYRLDYAERLSTTYDAIAKVVHELGCDDEERAIAEELMLGYHARWHEEPLVTEFVEHQFQRPLVNPLTSRPSRTYDLGGKIDALVTDSRDGRRYLVEHKTTSSDIGEGSDYWQRLRMDGQVSAYYHAFSDVAGCLYDVIRRPGQRRYKATPEDQRKYTQGKKCKCCKGKPWPVTHEVAEMAGFPEQETQCPACKGSGLEEPPKLYANQREHDESLDEFRLRIREAIASEPDAYYKRGVVVRLDTEIREHLLDVWHLATAMREMSNDGIHPRNPDACIQFNRRCDYFDVCTGVASIDDPRLYQISESAHPELKETK